MTLPASRPITLAQVCTEFGAPSNTTLGAFVRGGSWVPNTPGNSGVPTAKPITLGDLLGASAAPPYSASAAPSSVYGERYTTPGTATTNSCTVTVTGSAGSITRSWTRVSGDAAISISSTTAATVTWSASMSALNSYRTATWKCTVTDSILGVTTTNNVIVELAYIP